MGLDIYVGSFTRYYSHDWETVIQKAGREQGKPVVIVRSDSQPGAITDPAQVHEAMLQWRGLLLQGLHQAGSGVESLDWDERADAPYFTDKPGWDCFGALLILASHEQAVVPILTSRYPKRLPDEWQKDFRLQGATAARGRYAHLLGCGVWLPVDFPDPFEGPKPNAQPTRFGSSIRLQQQLIELNQRTYHGSADDLTTWGGNMPDPADRTFAPMAKTGLAIMLALVESANQNRLPMLLDF